MPHPATRFCRLRLGGPPEALEAAAATAWEAGACGFEEPVVMEGSPRSELIVYAPIEAIAPLESSLRDWAARHAPAVRVGPREAVPEVDWTARYREHQPVVEVSPRLRIRPPWVPGSPRDIVIEARQAFGTGAHASTALALQGLDRELARRPADRVLDVGSGSGVLAIAALRCGAGRVYACDVDPQAARETAENARRNGVGAKVEVWCGSLDACRLVDVDLAVANMVRQELLPLLPRLVEGVASDARLWLSGLLRSDVDSVAEALRRLGFAIRECAEREDAGDHWVALAASRSSGGPRARPGG